MGIISDHGGTKAPAQSSAKVLNPVGSGSRPVASKVKIPSSAPSNPQKLDSRGDVKGALK